ncbi:MAG: hypothetical protein K1X79_07605 [Oligoflexia bacterium]|nr:hypothetical protein [Oligoflexia bacterium]
MYTTPLTVRKQSVQALSSTTGPVTREAETTSDGTNSSDFDTLMRGVLKPDQANNVNEEELFAGLILERVYTLKGKDEGDSFRTLLDQHKAQNTGNGGYVFYEKAARDALKAYQESGKLSVEEADRIHSEAFSAAQLDSNKTALFDSIGGQNDPTRAVASIDVALAGAKALIDKYTAGTESPTQMLLRAEYPALGINPISKTINAGKLGGLSSSDKEDVTPKGNKIDGADGMLYKPLSYTQHKAILMLPPSFAGEVKSIVMRNEDGKVVDRAKYFSGGNPVYPREKWVFRKRGEDLPENVTVQIKFKDGTAKSVKLAHPSQRYD